MRSMAIVAFSELWNSTAAHPANQRLRAHGREPDDPDHYVVRGLIRNVIHAAGAVEYTVEKLEAAIDADEAWLNEFAPEKQPREHPVGIVGPNRDVAHYEFANLLFWLKALQERIKTKLPGHPRRDWGLLPALASGEVWTARIGDAYAALCGQAFDGRLLANFVTHSAVVPSPYGSLELVDGRLVMPIPDPPGQIVYLVDELRYEQGRDARDFARGALSAVETFVDAMLAALEDANREISERRAADQRDALT